MKITKELAVHAIERQKRFVLENLEAYQECGTRMVSLEFCKKLVEINFDAVASGINQIYEG